MRKIILVLAVAAIAMPAFAQPMWSSARNLTGNHQIHEFNNGVLGASVDQVAGAQGSGWGYRDGAFDGTYMYFGWESGLARHNMDGSGGTTLVAGGAPGGVATWRALAYDPTGNSGRGSIWTASFSSPLAEVDMNGALLNTFPTCASLYGLAYDDATGNLFGHDTGGAVVSIDTTTGACSPAWGNGFPNLAAQGGLSGISEMGGTHVAAVSQGTPDELGVYQISTGTLTGGPWNMEVQTGSNGHLGVAVTPEPTTLALLALGGLALLRRR